MMGNSVHACVGHKLMQSKYKKYMHAHKNTQLCVFKVMSE